MQAEGRRATLMDHFICCNKTQIRLMHVPQSAPQILRGRTSVTKQLVYLLSEAIEPSALRVPPPLIGPAIWTTRRLFPVKYTTLINHQLLTSWPPPASRAARAGRDSLPGQPAARGGIQVTYKPPSP